MSTVAIIWLLSLVVSGVVCVLARDSRRHQAKTVFVFVVSAFVFYSLVVTQTREGRVFKAQPVLESDRAEILLRLGTAMRVVESKMLSMLGTGGKASSKQVFKERDFHDEASSILEEAINKNPSSTRLKVQLTVVLGDSGKLEVKPKLLKLANELALRKEPKEKRLGNALLLIYGDRKVAGSLSGELGQIFADNLPNGWYRDATLLRLYKVAGDSMRYKELKETIENRAYRLFSNFLTIVAVGSIASLIGVVVIVVQLILLGRANKDNKTEKEQVPWGLKTVYVVFVLWLATQIVIGTLTAGWLRSWGLLTSGALIAGLSTALLYLISNGPGVVYAYWLAFKPYGVGLVDAVRLYPQVSNRGPVSLLFSGLMTWCAAVPIVMIAYLLASKFVGSQGSSNPIISLVLEAARSSNYLAILCFYLTLGVLAPLCEEILFRGFLYRTLRKQFSTATALFVSASVFSLVHMDTGAIAPLLCLGWLFGFVFEKTKSLIPSIVAHGLWNSGTFTLVLLIFGN